MRLKIVPVLLLPLLCSGCAGSFEQPDLPVSINPKNTDPDTSGTSVTFYSLEEYESDLKTYNTDVANGAYSEAKDVRNKMITLIAADIDFNYGEYRGTLHVGRAGIETAGDAASLGLTAAITVVGGTALKSILGAADTALKGTVQSYSNNFYEQKATEVLISSMDSIRTTQETLIIKNLALSVEDYPFGEARMDLIKLFFLGTREAGLTSLEADAGKKSVDATTQSAAAAQERVDQSALSSPVTDDQVKMMRAIENQVLILAKNSTGDLQQGVAILKRAGVTPSNPTDINAVVSDLKKLQLTAYHDPTKLQAVYQDFFPQ